MTRLEKYLMSIARDVINAETTSSRYLLIDNLKVRISDHLSKSSDGDLEIIVPYNGGNIYTVIVFKSQRYLSYNAKQIKELIPVLITLKGLQAPVINRSTPVPIATKIKECQTPTLNWDGIMLKTKLQLKMLGCTERLIFNKRKAPWNAGEIGALPSMLLKEFNRSDGVNDDFQIFLTCTSLTYEEVINIYKIIVISNPNKATINALQQALLMIS